MNPEDLEKLGLKKRMVALDKEVDYEIVHAICQRLLVLNAVNPVAKITLLIDSNGGRVEAGWELFDMIQSIRAPVRGIVVGVANSMAFTILQACKDREACPHSSVLVHPIKFEATLAELRSEEFRKEKEEVANRIIEVCAKRAKVGKEKVRELHENENKLTADQALEYGFIDRITEPGSI